MREPAIDGLGMVADRDPRTIAAALAPLLQTCGANLMAAMHRCGAAAVPHYTGLLKHSDVQARLSACNALLDLADGYALADKAKDAVPALAALARTAECRGAAIEAIRAIAPEIAFGPLLEALERDPVVGATLRRAGKGGREPGKIMAVLLRDLRDADPRVGRDAAEALVQLETITWQEHERYYLTTTIRTLEAIPALAARRLNAADTETRRNALAQLIALKSLVGDMCGRLDRTTALEGGVTLETRQTEFANLWETIQDSLVRAGNNSNREIRRMGRRAMRVRPIVNTWPTWLPDCGFGGPQLPVRVHAKRREAAA